MNARDILHYGHATALKTFENISDKEWKTVGATSAWTPQNVLAHLIAYEAVLAEALAAQCDPAAATPTLNAYRSGEASFNDNEVAKRNSLSRDELLKEYEMLHERVMTLVSSIHPEELSRPGTIPWYGTEYSLDDFVVYTNYAHIREHTGQIKLFLRYLRKS